MSKYLWICLIALALFASSAQAAILLTDNFDSYADQTAFAAAWTANTTTATLDTTLSFSASNSVKAGTTAMRNYRTFADTTPTTGTAVEFAVRYYDSSGTAAAYRQYAELDDTTAPAGNGQLFAIGLNNNIASSFYMARILGGDGGAGVSQFFKLDGTGTPNSGNAALNRVTGWHELKVDVKADGVGGGLADYYVDGLLARTGIAFATIRGYDTVKVGSNLSSTSTANFDDVLVQTVAVPEPAALGMLAVAGIGLLRRRRA